MIWTFILGVVAGCAAPALENWLRPLLAEHISGDEMSALEWRTIALAIALFIAAIVATLSASSHVLPLTLGVLIGVLGPRLFAKFRQMWAPDYDS